MSKNQNKKSDDPRKPIGDVDTRKRKAIGRRVQMDITAYQERFGKEMKLMLIVDDGGDLDYWLDAGAKPVERSSTTNHNFEGLSDRHQCKWVRFVAGVDQGGNTLYQYLLMMEHSLYNELKIQPNKDRQAEVRRAMGRGAEEGAAPIEARAVNVAGVKTYAPYNMDGSTGLNQEFNSIR